LPGTARSRLEPSAGGFIAAACRQPIFRTSAVAIVRAVNVPFLVFVLPLGVVVPVVMRNGVAERMGALSPSGSGLAALLGFRGGGRRGGQCRQQSARNKVLVLAVLIGVNIGPNLARVESLSNLLWRSVYASAVSRLASANTPGLDCARCPPRW
jgi:arsenical pump membrane protein